MGKGMKERQIMVVIKEPGKGARVEPLFDNSLESFQNAVGGFIECVDLSPDTVLICNEEGKLMDLPYNFTLGGWDSIVGTVVVCGVRGDEFSSLKSFRIPMILDMLGR